MLHSGCSLFGDVWDTNRASQFLKISAEELQLLDSIPGWSKIDEETDEKQTSESEINAVTKQNPSIPLQTIPVNTATKQSPTFIQNPNIATNILVPNSNSPQEISRSTDKDDFMRHISLFSNKAVDAFPSLPRKRSSSVSDIYLLKVNESMSSSKSETNLMKISRNTSTEQFISDRYSAKKIKFSNFIPGPLEDKTNHNPTATDIHLDKDSEILSERETFEHLEAGILNHPYHKETLPIEHKSESNDFPSIAKIKDMCHEQLQKKLELLQKRFSQSGKCDLLKGRAENEVDFECIGSQKQFPAISESAEKVSETQTRETCLSNLINNNKEINPITAFNTSTNATTSSSHGIQSPGKTKQKQSESHTAATQAENETVAKLNPNVPEDKSCASQQSKLNPVVIHLSKSGNIPPSSDFHSFSQSNSINLSEMNTLDPESNLPDSCIITLSIDTHSFAYSQPATVQSKDVDICVPVLCGIPSSPDAISSDQPHLKSHPETLLKSKNVDMCAPVPCGISSPPDAISSGQPHLKSHPDTLLKSKNVDMCVPVPCGSDTISSGQLRLKSYPETLLKSKDVDMWVPVTCGISSSPDPISSGQPHLKSYPETLLKSKDADTCVSVPVDIPQSPCTLLSIQSNGTSSEVHCTSSPSRMSSVRSTALSQSLISKMRSPAKFKGPGSRMESATSPSTDPQMFMRSSVVNHRPETKDEDSMKVSEAEKEGATFSVFSDNPSGWVVSNSSASGEVGKASSGKRKRESKGDHKPHKKLPLSNSPVDIRYTAEQVRNMIEIMRFQFKM